MVVFAEIAQVVERRPEKPGVASASLALGILLRSNVFTFELRSNVPAKREHKSIRAKQNKSGSRHFFRPADSDLLARGRHVGILKQTTSQSHTTESLRRL